MKQFDDMSPPAIVRSAESLASLALKLKAYHARNREENRQHGQFLLEAQELCQREGKSWEAWLENETGIAQTTARRWMMLAKNQGCEEEETAQVVHTAPADSPKDHVTPQGPQPPAPPPLTAPHPSAVQPKRCPKCLMHEAEKGCPNCAKLNAPPPAPPPPAPPPAPPDREPGDDSAEKPRQKRGDAWEPPSPEAKWEATKKKALEGFGILIRALDDLNLQSLFRLQMEQIKRGILGARP